MLKPAMPPKKVDIMLTIPVMDEVRPGGASSKGIELTTRPKAPFKGTRPMATISSAGMPLVLVINRKAMPAASNIVAIVAKTRSNRTTRARASSKPIKALTCESAAMNPTK